MNMISISDVTMKQSGRAAGVNLSFREKIELSKQLDRLGVDVIETSPIVNPKVDALLIKSISTAVKHAVVAVPTGLAEEDAQRAWNALSEAKRPRLQVCAPVSAVQMEYLAHKKPAAMLEAIGEAVRRAKDLCPDVEFWADDATGAAARAAAAADDTLHCTSSGPTNVEVMDLATSKGSAARWLCSHLGVAPADAIAFGDSPNDLSMAPAVGAFVAMANASPDVKAAATCVSAHDCDHAGVARHLMPLL